MEEKLHSLFLLRLPCVVKEYHGGWKENCTEGLVWTNTGKESILKVVTLGDEKMIAAAFCLKRKMKNRNILYVDNKIVTYLPV